MTEEQHEELRADLRRLAAPASPPVDGRTLVLDRLARRRRRRNIVVAVSCAAAAVMLGAGVGLVLDRTRPVDVDSPDVTTTDDVGAGRWTALPTSPLPARHDAVGVWTGSEVIVVGGTTQVPCPPNADCGLDPDLRRADGAAYDPATDAWRTIADAPVPFVAGQAVWSGTEMIVVVTGRTLAYDPAADAWRELPSPPSSIDEPAPPVVTDEGIVFTSYDQRPGGDPTDLVLDPATGAWSALPSDPFGESYDRSLAWDGDRLWLLSMAVEQHFGAYAGATSRLAVLEGGLSDGTWRVVDEETPPVFQGQVLWWTGDGLTVPAAAPGREVTRYYDPERQTWTENAARARGDCPLPRVGPGADWVADGPTLTSLDGSRTVTVPSCHALSSPDVAVWADDRLILWGGPGAGFRANSANGLSWEPPDS